MLTLIIICFVYHMRVMISPLYAYRDGARENSCYDHSIEHGPGTVTFACAPPSCPFFLRIKEVVNEDTLELGNETSTYECGRIYGIELATSLNDPEGFLIQARNGTDVSSEIVGTFLDPDVVRVRNPTMQINYKILRCNHSISDTESEAPIPNSATHPTTGDEAAILQLYWQAPNCSTCGLGDLRIWFSVVQQLQIVFRISKITALRFRNNTESPPFKSTATTTAVYTISTSATAAYITLATARTVATTKIVTTTTTQSVEPSSTTIQCHTLSMSTSSIAPSSGPFGTRDTATSSSDQYCIITTVIAAVICSLLFFIIGAISGGVGALCIATIFRQRRSLRLHSVSMQLAPTYAEDSLSDKSVLLMARNPTSTEDDPHIELEVEAEA